MRVIHGVYAAVLCPGPSGPGAAMVLPLDGADGDRVHIHAPDRQRAAGLARSPRSSLPERHTEGTLAQVALRRTWCAGTFGAVLGVRVCSSVCATAQRHTLRSPTPKTTTARRLMALSRLRASPTRPSRRT